ncbi:streptothricin acetyltransferase [Butyricimonas faecalis]|uniref:Streptothricin acetyltransferase n=1 Tax=Butyricimonas faecalis TaxID=2093856 RepID=A0A3Q9ING6_9BACT|nr:streptothricin acetyltransferase [Butyricimonas faecalis]
MKLLNINLKNIPRRYHNCGFKIGSVDTMLYANFENNFEKAVFWYLRF